MMNESSRADFQELDSLIERADAGDETAIEELFEVHSDRLRKMIRLRLNARLHGRVSESDILQETYLEAARRLHDYLENRNVALFVWLREITSRKIIDVYRRHLGAKSRDVRVEVQLHRGRTPVASSVSLAAQLLGQLTSPSQAAVKAETQMAIQQALAEMSEDDREILSMRCYEDLSNQEVAQELGIEESAASKRFLRSLQRIRVILDRYGIVQ